MIETKKKISPAAWFGLCPVRHTLTALGALTIALYFLLRGNRALLEAVCGGFVRPWHSAASRFCSLFPFSVAEVLIVAAVIAGVVYIMHSIVGIIRHPEKLKRAYRLVLTALCAFCVIYGGFCLLWGTYYYTADFEEQSGIYGTELSVEELETVTRYFTDLVNEYDAYITRDAQGCFDADMDAVFDSSATLYNNVEQLVPCLAGYELEVKPFFFSEALSLMTFTGFFFPFTAEANININCPEALIPSTIAHELAHQRGVAHEDEANFVAVLSSLESGDPVYCYSACLMAYIHLSNALHGADYEAWEENYHRLSPGVIADLQRNNAYWAPYRDTVVNSAADSVYTGMLHSYGEELGLQTYGKCVDLLVAYYYDTAKEAAG